MPIRPEMRDKYPKDWPAISKRIRERAGQRCECTGQCKSAHEGGRCNAPNGAIIKRGETDPAHWEVHHGCSLCLGGDDECHPIKVILTVAHLNHEPSDVRDENLLAACQRCHLRYDSATHRVNAAATRNRNRDEASGQQPLYKEKTV
jgi:hypothetical protein